ncbi:AbiJ-NTD4 domain-containing protein, partial [Nocardia heshunensis]
MGNKTIMRFSERMGFVKVDDVIQKDKMNETLRNDIFNYGAHILFDKQHSNLQQNYQGTHYEMLKQLWVNFFHISISSLTDEMAMAGDNPNEVLHNHYDDLQFYEVYDFLEYVIQIWGRSSESVKTINQLLSTNHSAYRFIKYQLEPVSSDIDISNITAGVKT